MIYFSVLLPSVIKTVTRCILLELFMEAFIYKASSQSLHFGKPKLSTGITKLSIFHNDDDLSGKPKRHNNNNNKVLIIGLSILAYDKNTQK